MTTIAFDGRYIACDSRITGDRGHIHSDSRIKYTDTKDWLIFWCGATNDIDDFINSFLGDSPVKDDVNVGLYAYQKSTKFVYEVGKTNGYTFRNRLVDQDAVGSGADHAITAMDCGKTAVESIKMAMKRDSATGGIIRCFDTHTGKFIKVKQ
jgi:hypothetical protein